MTRGLSSRTCSGPSLSRELSDRRRDLTAPCLPTDLASDCGLRSGECRAGVQNLCVPPCEMTSRAGSRLIISAVTWSGRFRVLRGILQKTTSVTICYPHTGWRQLTQTYLPILAGRKPADCANCERWGIFPFSAKSESADPPGGRTRSFGVCNSLESRDEACLSCSELRDCVPITPSSEIVDGFAIESGSCWTVGRSMPSPS